MVMLIRLIQNKQCIVLREFTVIASSHSTYLNMPFALY